VQPPAGRRGQAEEQPDPGRHGDRGQPVPPPHPHPSADDRHEAEDKQKLERQNGLD
jgi:hypothetical protein